MATSVFPNGGPSVVLTQSPLAGDGSIGDPVTLPAGATLTTPDIGVATGTSLEVDSLAVGPLSVLGGTSLAVFSNSYPTILDIEQEVTDMSVWKLNTAFGTLLNPAADTVNQYDNFYSELITTGSKNFGGELLAGFVEFDHNGSGDVNLAGGFSMEAYNDAAGNITNSEWGLAGGRGSAGSYGSGTVARMTAVDSVLKFLGSSSSIPVAANFRAKAPVTGGTDSVAVYAGLLVEEQTYGATNWAILTEGATPSQFGGVVQAGGYKSSDGTAGVTAGPFTVITGITVKNGLVTAITGS